MPPITYRDLTTLVDFAGVVDLEREIWGPGYDEVVPVPILAVTVMRGGILIGAFDGDRLIGFVYSLPGIKHGKPTQWSHMLGVLDAFRRAGVGYQLKILQRERTLAMGLDLIEWTYDPLQAMNAHLNFAKLGVVADEYEVNVYGDSTSPLHKGNPTDRFVAAWCVGTARVEGRLRGVAPWSRPAGRSPPASGWSPPRSISRWTRSASASRFQPGSARCCRARRTSRSNGAWPRAGCSPAILPAATAPWSSSSIENRGKGRTCWSARSRWHAERSLRSFHNRSRCIACWTACLESGQPRRASLSDERRGASNPEAR
jgi:predicted GNAT superfamily acetyltransferase